jgi:N-acetylneuraminate synthase
MTFFIAEVSSNHSSDLERCKDFIDAASDVGCDAVKFQLFKVNQLFSKEVLENSKAHRDREQWELPEDYIPLLYEHCKERNIQFSCTPFYLEAVDLLEKYVDFFKIASYELLWDSLIERCSKTTKPLIISTGMANISEILHAKDVSNRNNCEDLTFLHCNSAYPTPYKDANLSAIQTIREETGCKTGWSDHTVCPSIIHRVIHKWNASTIEFHLDLDKKGDEYSAGHCWLPNEIERVIKEVREGIAADGHGKKESSASEIADRDWRADPSDGLRPLKKIRKTL